MPSLPPFLEPLDIPHSAQSQYQDAIFRHKQPIGPVHSLWWPCKQDGNQPDTILFFIPGNPGLLGFYPPFLSAIQDKASSAKLAILAHAHVGHTPGIGDEFQRDAASYGLITQVQSAVEALDAVKLSFGSKTKIVLLAHSIGSWFALQVLKARPDSVHGLHLLFPTISNIGSTPNGQKLSWMFYPPIPRIISALSPIARVASSLLPLIFRPWPQPQIQVLQGLIRSPTSIFATLTMAHEEMSQVRELDTALLSEYKDRIWFYYAEHDDWVGEQREVVLRTFNADSDSVRVVRGHRDIPHAFCINHGEQVAEQCYQWLSSGGFL